MLARITELRLAFAFVAVGLVVLASRSIEPGAPAHNLSSRTAIELANTLAEGVEELRYDDPRLAPTRGFALPDRSLAPDLPGLTSLWKIVEHEPARFMKTIEIRVRWSRRGDDREVAVTTVKSS